MTVPLEFREVALGGGRRRSTWGGRRAAADDSYGALNLTVERHETVVAIGDESSGVDGLGALALGLERGPGGAVWVFGTVIATLERRAQLAFRRQVGYLPAGDGLLQNLTLRENIQLPMRFGSDFQSGDIEGRTRVILAQLRIDPVAGVRPAQANEEERRRAALGRALALDPELVILEEPFVGLTERAAAELLEVARGGELPEGGRRTLFITGQDLPMILRSRVERTVRIARGARGVVAL